MPAARSNWAPSARAGCRNCAATSRGQILFSLKNPTDYTDFVHDLARPRGEAELPSGKKVFRPDDWDAGNDKAPNRHGLPGMSTNPGRTISSQLTEPVFMQVGYGTQYRYSNTFDAGFQWNSPKKVMDGGLWGEQEAKVLRQLQASDAGLYVIDAREPVLAKYRDELAVLAGCARPLLPVLNFVASANHREEQWREALSRLGLHALVRFDSVAPPLDGERRLYESLALLLEKSRPQLERLIRDHEAQAVARREAGAKLIAELLVDVAACRDLVPGDAEAIRLATEVLRDRVRKREEACVQALLRLYADIDSDDHGGLYRSAELDESLRDGVEEAADFCPSQAISVEG